MSMTRADIDRIRSSIPESVYNDLQLIFDRLDLVTKKLTELEYSVSLLLEDFKD
jgi:hypothetical protein